MGWRTLVILTAENLKMAFFRNMHFFLPSAAKFAGSRRYLLGKLFLTLFPLSPVNWILHSWILLQFILQEDPFPWISKEGGMF